jgi:hypothetical protein
MISEALLWLFVVNLGIAYGAGLYEKRIVLPQWFTDSGDGRLHVNIEAMRQTNVGVRFWVYVTTVPLTILTLGNLVIAVQSTSARHAWWLAAGLIVLAERIATFTFFIPSAIALTRPDPPSVSAAGALASRWVRLNYLRDALGLLGWLAALRTLALPM